MLAYKNQLARFSFSSLFLVDLRSLKAFRVLLSLVVLYDTLDRLADFGAHYTDDGVLPRDVLLQRFLHPWDWSLLVISDSRFFGLLIFLAVLVAALLLLWGYKARYMSLLCWIGLISIQNRNPVIYQGGDDLLRMLLFWSVFLPLSGRQISEAQRKGFIDHCSIAGLAILLQVLFPFFFSGLFKDPGEWWTEGSALYYAFSLDQIARPLGLWFSRHFALSVTLTRCIYLMELLLLPVFFFPYHRDKIRLIVFGAIVLFNTGILCCLMIGIFPLCFLAASVLFLPSSAWDCLQSKVFKRQRSQLVLVRTCQKGRILSSGNKAVHQAGAGFLFVLVVLWNISAVPNSPFRFPNGFDALVHGLKLNQSWGMFAPTVLKEDGWLILKAKLRDNSVVDLNTDGGAISYAKPTDVLKRFKDDRWRKYTEQIVQGQNKFLLSIYASYLLNAWNKKQKVEARKADDLSIVFMQEFSRPYPASATLDRIELVNYRPFSPESFALNQPVVNKKFRR